MPPIIASMRWSGGPVSSAAGAKITQARACITTTTPTSPTTPNSQCRLWPPDSSHAHVTRVRLAAVRAAREELIRLWQEATISDEVLHHLEEELDYEESRL